MVFRIFNVVGICSIVACIYLAIQTGGLLTEFGRLLRRWSY